MRISTTSIYQTAVLNFNDMQSNIATSLNQIDTGKALTSPADNPAAASQVLVIAQSDSINTQYGVNRQNVSNSLNTSDGILSGVTSILQNMESLVVQGGNGSLSPSDRASVAQQFQSSMNQLLNLANSTDSNGNYLFSGSTSNVPAYATAPSGAVYTGNQVSQMVQVDASQQTATTTVGSSIFGNIAASPNAFFGIPDGGNVSTATISAGTVANSALLTGDNYSIKFTSPTTYDVTDTSLGTVVSSANAYTTGTPITFDGIQISVTNGAGATGVPVTGDQFAVQPGNQNIFQAITNIANALNQSTLTPAGQKNLAAALSQGNSSISASLNNVLTVRAQYGNSMQQVTSLNSVGNTVGLTYQSTMSNLQDVNYAKAISQLSLEQFTYQAAQKAFASTSQLSLISMLR